MTLDKFAQAQRADGYSINTIGARVRCIKAIARFAGVAASRLKVEHVIAYFAARPLRPWSRRTYLNHLQAFGKWLGADLTQGIRKPAAPRSTPHPLPEDELSRLTDTARGAAKAWVLLGAFCGLRAHETAKLSRRDLSVLDDGTAVLRVTGKGGRTDTVPVPPVVMKALDLTREGRFWDGTRPESVSRTVAYIAAKLGIRMRYHQLRHRFGTMVYRSSGRDLLMTQRLMRHASPATTAGYAAVADDRVHVVVHALPGADPDAPKGRKRKTAAKKCLCGQLAAQS
ncbi:tyrosine-type recombinase/integrase [Streptomyces aidingensis]|uniref:Site-specific recombinase XerD n=1 Tax=Streptomyces aidingensis TaxID=910347 RepID=A0A1I1UYA3_9ACTN|nr:tyrosine-type recombinase/integrase [Streptomyces aidingensis]SFD73000.1 Site-specific recombinase XerD [Streptomyces aidingensis]